MRKNYDFDNDELRKVQKELEAETDVRIFASEWPSGILG